VRDGWREDLYIAPGWVGDTNSSSHPGLLPAPGCTSLMSCYRPWCRHAARCRVVGPPGSER